MQNWTILEPIVLARSSSAVLQLTMAFEEKFSNLAARVPRFYDIDPEEVLLRGPLPRKFSGKESTHNIHKLLPRCRSVT